MLIHRCRQGGDFWKVEVLLSLSDALMSWLRLYTTPLCISYPFFMYIKCFGTMICCGGYMGAPLRRYTSAGGGRFLEN
jgi:hypothetical protein